MRRFLVKIIAAMGTMALVATLGVVAQAAPAAHGPQYQIVQAGAKDGGGEPSIAVDDFTTSPHRGTIYVSWPGRHVNMSVSSDNGSTWNMAVQPQNVDSVGDTSVAIDSSGAVYQTNLNNIEPSDKTLQAVLWKSLDQGQTWQQGAGFANPDNSSNMPLFVDRQWNDSYIPPGSDTSHADVYLSYHDFVPSQIWVNTSTDGGKTFGAPTDVITSPQAEAASFCNTIPGGLKVVQSGPHAGRVYVAWLTADAPTNVATGCNLTQMDTFHSIWMAYSDDQGATWTDQQVYDGGFGHDASGLFSDLTLDNRGEPYIATADNLNGEWDMYVIGSTVAADQAAGPVFTTPFKVNSDTGTHFFPAIAVGDPGKVDVAYIRTPTVIPMLPYGKPKPGGGAGASWYLYAAQTQNLWDKHGAKWTVQQLTPNPMHVGDVCTLGIFCVDDTTGLPVFGTNRDLLDFIDVAVDPKGFSHIAYTADVPDATGIFVANQTGGPNVGSGTPKH